MDNIDKLLRDHPPPWRVKNNGTNAVIRDMDDHPFLVIVIRQGSTLLNDTSKMHAVARLLHAGLGNLKE